MNHLCQECEICMQLKKGIVPRALDFGHAPCSAALEKCRRLQNSLKPNPQAELLFADLTQGCMVMEPSVYYVDTDSEEEVPLPDKLKNELPPTEISFKSFVKSFWGCVLC
ncbi:hypothetical protein DSO57_1027311 [Entomophthora muscae]|uniref:Uncharacterized protein n=1 Tax=Entomophthora muscae TaxID=34485 RepID=A0ACC2RSS1_9FUNG|nr:hypothetical protein DSO57_1027311 [Entomophthora muscae]